MSANLDIYPFQDSEGAVRFGIQILIVLVGLYVTNKFVIKPLLNLYSERKKRTTGTTESAKLKLDQAKKLEQNYKDNFDQALGEVTKAHEESLKIAHHEAEKIINHAKSNADKTLSEVKKHLDEHFREFEEEVPKHIDELSKDVFSRILTLLIFGFFGLLAFKVDCFASDDSHDVIQSFWYSVFWPYFQFLVFLVAIVYFAKKPILAYLESQRDNLRTRLAEAREAVTLADRKVQEYQEKMIHLNQEIADLRSRFEEDTIHERNKIIDEARKLSLSILGEADRASKDLISQAKEQLKQELISGVFQKVEKTLAAEKMTELEKKLKQDLLETLKTSLVKN